MASAQFHRPSDMVNTKLSARDLETKVSLHTSTLQDLYNNPARWIYDERLAIISNSWFEKLRGAVHLASQITCVNPHHELAVVQLNRLFELIDVLHHWISNQRAVHSLLEQVQPLADLSFACNDLGGHIPLVRSTIAALALSDFGPWLEEITDDDQESIQTTNCFELAYEPTGYTINWDNLNGCPVLDKEPHINLDLLFPQGKPFYMTPQTYAGESSTDELAEEFLDFTEADVASIDKWLDGISDFAFDFEEYPPTLGEDEDDEYEAPEWFMDDYTEPSEVNTRWEGGRLHALHLLERQRQQECPETVVNPFTAASDGAMAITVELSKKLPMTFPDRPCLLQVQPGTHVPLTQAYC